MKAINYHKLSESFVADCVMHGYGGVDYLRQYQRDDLEKALTAFLEKRFPRDSFGAIPIVATPGMPDNLIVLRGPNSELLASYVVKKD